MTGTQTVGFKDCILECCQTEQLVTEFNRLTGRRLSFVDKRLPIERMIDQATGYDKAAESAKHEDMQAFISFVFVCVWLPLLLESRKP